MERAGVAPNAMDGDGQTPLLWEAENGYRAIAKMLLEWEAVTTDRTDIAGRTPLSWFAEKGHEDIVKIIKRPLGRN